MDRNWMYSVLFTNNDNWFYSSWFDRGLHHLQHKAKETTIMNKPDGSIVLAFTVESQAPHAAKNTGWYQFR